MANRRGFTIVELIVVITIIALLAAVAVVSYNSAQSRARDSVRKNDIASLAKQIQIYGLQKQTFTGNCGDSTDTLNGYTNYDYAVSGNVTITECLKAFDPTNKQLNDPSGCLTLTDATATCKTSIRSAYAAYNTIATNGHFYLVTKLETEVGTPTIDSSDMDATLQTNVKGAGFNYLLKVR